MCGSFHPSASKSLQITAGFVRAAFSYNARTFTASCRQPVHTHSPAGDFSTCQVSNTRRSTPSSDRAVTQLGWLCASHTRTDTGNASRKLPVLELAQDFTCSRNPPCTLQLRLSLLWEKQSSQLNPRHHAAGRGPPLPLPQHTAVRNPSNVSTTGELQRKRSTVQPPKSRLFGTPERHRSTELQVLPARNTGVQHLRLPRSAGEVQLPSTSTEVSTPSPSPLAEGHTLVPKCCRAFCTHVNLFPLDLSTPMENRSGHPLCFAFCRLLPQFPPH